MDRTIIYPITPQQDGLRVEQFLRRMGYSAQNLASIKRMPESILVNGVPCYMKHPLAAADQLQVRISYQRTEMFRKNPARLRSSFHRL